MTVLRAASWSLIYTATPRESRVKSPETFPFATCRLPTEAPICPGFKT